MLYRYVDVTDVINTMYNEEHLPEFPESLDRIKVAKLLGDTPTANAERVVRCKDCIYNNHISCPLCYVEKHDLCFVQHDPDFYCAKGVRDNASE